MKKHHLIFGSTFVFVILFYQENLGINLGIFGVLLSLVTLIITPKQRKTKTFLILFVLSLFSSFAFAWYGDFVSFAALIISILLLRYKAQNKNMKAILALPIGIINGFTFICKFFNFDSWLDVKSPASNSRKGRLFIWLIPLLFFVTFFFIYSTASKHFSDLLNFDWNLDFPQILVLSILGFYLTFNYWLFSAEKFSLKYNRLLSNQFEKNFHLKKPTPTYSFIDIDSERMSGIVSFVVLNLLLLIFICTFNYEQFFENRISASQLSSDTHQRINTIIISIIMAVLVTLFYFKSHFNFDEKAKHLKLLAKVWLLLNAVLVISAGIKNTEYILHFGLTYKRLGVYTFLILCIIGLFFTYLKVINKKTNAYLFNHMFWYFYGTVLVCSFINWGSLITTYNINTGKGQDYDFIQGLNFNHQQIIDNYYRKNPQIYFHDKEYMKQDIKSNKNNSFLSKSIYYETLPSNF
ncbi:DUF4153 domain-containing protein [Riemerella anatipestifer]|uniref:DUF4153 domain-containing protein n=1 Tax=Riemerella anatipestifer TaxID=34085 RepID=UPI00069A89F9|nr:DUF4173 domain-containing protein [Riemerella anatipestifer]